MYDAWGNADFSVSSPQIDTGNKFGYTGEALDPGTLPEYDFPCDLIDKVDLVARCAELLSNRIALSASKSACISMGSTREGEWIRSKMAISALSTLPSISRGSRS